MSCAVSALQEELLTGRPGAVTPEETHAAADSAETAAAPKAKGFILLLR